VSGRSNARIPELGELERAALDHLWTKGEADVIEIHRAIGVKRGISANTVGSALERLYRKGLAVRTKVSHAYRYAAACKREEFLGRQIAATLGDMRILSRSGVLASFVDAVTDADRNALDELENLIARKKTGLK
jgi:predicted transcriptional regulator